MNIRCYQDLYGAVADGEAHTLIFISSARTSQLY